MSLLGKTSTFGQEKNEAGNTKAKIEQLVEKTAGYEKDISMVIKEKGQAGKMNETPIRRWKSSNEKVTTIGYSNDETKAKWLISENNDASMRFFDKDADGSVDRIIVNKETLRLGVEEKVAFNDLKTFDSIQGLAEEANASADLDPENIIVYEINYENNNFVMRKVDFQSGEASELSGPDAERLVVSMQSRFTDSMEWLKNQVKK